MICRATERPLAQAQPVCAPATYSPAKYSPRLSFDCSRRISAIWRTYPTGM